MGVSLRSASFVAFCLVALANCVHAQDPKPKVPLDFSNDPCGNPLVESQLWLVVEGSVYQVPDGQTVVVSLKDKRMLRVRIAGISVKSSDATAAKAKELLSQFLGKPVEILVNTDWNDEKQKPSKVTAVVGDFGYLLLSKGLARYHEPRQYTMSSYSTCQYRQAEAQARTAKLGIWAQN